jgi:protein-S-isoprenylcysteine O-methyltransferase Ste14
MEYVPILELPVLIVMVVIRALTLRKQGVKAIVFGETDRSDFILIPCALFFFYGAASSVFEMPFPPVLKKQFLNSSVLSLCAIIICTLSLVFFFLALRTFGRSFRVGIDENTDDVLITGGVFKISRNPVYTAFIFFFLGICIAYPNIITTVFLIMLIIMIHRQVLREEKFLKNHYGEAYEEYCGRVRRYI